MTTPLFPEHEKLHKVKDRSQTCGLFIDWLAGQGYHLCEIHEHSGDKDDEGESGCYKDGDRLCGYRNGQYFPTMRRLEDLLAGFFDIDQRRLEDEKVAILNQLRQQHTTVQEPTP